MFYEAIFRLFCGAFGVNNFISAAIKSARLRVLEAATRQRNGWLCRQQALGGASFNRQGVLRLLLDGDRLPPPPDKTPSLGHNPLLSCRRESVRVRTPLCGRSGVRDSAFFEKLCAGFCPAAAKRGVTTGGRGKPPTIARHHCCSDSARAIRVLF